MSDEEIIKWVGRISYSGEFYYIRVPKEIGKRLHGSEGEVTFRIVRRKKTALIY